VRAPPCTEFGSRSTTAASRTAGSGEGSSLPYRSVWLPLHRCDRQRRSLVRTHPTGRGTPARGREPVGSALAVGHLDRNVFIERSALDRIPAVIFLRRPHCDCPVSRSAIVAGFGGAGPRWVAKTEPGAEPGALSPAERGQSQTDPSLMLTCHPARSAANAIGVARFHQGSAGWRDGPVPESAKALAPQGSAGSLERLVPTPSDPTILHFPGSERRAPNQRLQ
jgi:hypothetical protein